MSTPIITNIDPRTLETSVFSTQDSSLITSYTLNSTFNSTTDVVEYYIFDSKNNLINQNTNSTNYNLESVNPGSANSTTITINPENDLKNSGYARGIYKILYNFLSPKLGTIPFFIKEISPDRTEIRLQSNSYSNVQLETLFNLFKDELFNSVYFDEFYINFSNNNLYIGINALLDTSTSDYTILIKLYQPLPTTFTVKDTLTITTKVVESIAYSITFPEEAIEIDNRIFLQGPNINIPTNNKIGISSNYYNHNQLLSSPLSSSHDQLQSILNEKGVELNIDYTDYSNFVYFSSIYQRLINFYNKVSDIENYQNDLTILNNITGSTSASLSVSSSKAAINNEITDIIKNFDGYEYYLYYESSSFAWPKSTSQYPYILYSTGSAQVLTWLGSTNIGSAYYGGQLLSASLYDNENQNNLTYTIPEFIREDSNNNQYLLFVEMVGQFFDNLWLYTKAITDKMNADNRVNYGISADLVSEVLQSFGQKIYTNQFSLNDLYSAFLGSTPSGSTSLFYGTTGSLPTPSGLEYINNYVTASNNIIPLDEANKRLYKRLYHNLPYLLKKKGTIEGLRSIGNIYGIPDTILRINEFGGKNKVNSNDWDQWQSTFNYAYGTIGQQGTISIPWKPLSTTNQYPQSIEFRFKTVNAELAKSYPSQSLITITDPLSLGFNGLALLLEYTGSGYTSGSYSGSIIDPYHQYGTLKMYGNNTSASIYLPFFNDGWWSVLMTFESGSSTLYAKNSIYNGFDGNTIGFEASSTANIPSSSIYFSCSLALGGIQFYDSSPITINNKDYVAFTGSFQEFRYYSNVLNESKFNNYVVNPLSIEGNSETESAYNTLLFRAPLGSLLNKEENLFSLASIHPSITGSIPSLITQSFIDGTSTYGPLFPDQSPLWYNNYETMFLDSPNAGLDNVVNNKIQIVDSSSFYGNILSQYITLEQNPEINQTYSPNINLLEVVFSPQNETNIDIINSLGFNSISDAIADPRQVSESTNRYTNLDRLASEYFKKYSSSYNIYDYLRLIKYFDNSLFKLVKDYTPARTKLSSGILIKQHLLERNRYRPPHINLTENYNSFTGSVLHKSGSDTIYIFDGGAGGSVNKFNSLTPPFGVTQSYTESVETPVGKLTYINDYQYEFYNGEYSGSNIIVTTQSLNPDNIFLYTPVSDISTNISKSFYNSAFNPTINNILTNRINNFQVQVDYNVASGSLTPSNLFIINYFNVSGGNDTSSVLLNNLNDSQESNYSLKRHINPRYEGSRLYSANYNDYTTSSPSASFIDGTTGSWAGDISYGKTAVIDSYPQYIAHFSTAYESKEVLNTYTFVLDKLIYIPNRELTNDEKNNPSVLANNDILLNAPFNSTYTSFNFEPNRICRVFWNTPYISISSSVAGITGYSIDLSSINGNRYNTFDGGMEFKTLMATTIDPSYITNTSYSTSSLFNNITSSILIEQTTPSQLNSSFFITSSGYLQISGSTNTIYIVQNNPLAPSSTDLYIQGPSLALIHTYNQLLYNQIFGVPNSSGDIAIPSRDSTNPKNYYRFQPSGSNTPTYKNFDIPFLLQRGDEITIIYKTLSGTNIITQDFYITEIGYSNYDSYSTTPFTLQSGSLPTSNWKPKKIYDKIYVHPDPSTLSNPIPDGQVTNFVIRRRTNNNTSVILNIVPPRGSNGVLTPTGDGYLIPSDLSEIQSKNLISRIGI